MTDTSSSSDEEENAKLKSAVWHSSAYPSVIDRKSKGKFIAPFLGVRPVLVAGPGRRANIVLLVACSTVVKTSTFKYY